MIVSTAGLVKRYGAQTALGGVDLAVPENSVYGLVGPNGSGKTTLLGLLGGLRQPTAGQVTVAARGEWAMCPDTPAFEPWLTGREVLELAAGVSGHRPARDVVGGLLADAGLAEAADRRVGGYSRGMTQRLAVAATLVTNPRLVLLDEPCSALDPAGRVEVLDLIARSARDRTVIFSTHVLADVQRVCDVVGILDRGRLTYQGSLGDLLRRYSPGVWRIRLARPWRRAADALRTHRDVRSVTEVAPGDLRVELASAAVAISPDHLGLLAQAGASVRSITPEEADLETIFLAMTGTSGDDVAT